MEKKSNYEDDVSTLGVIRRFTRSSQNTDDIVHLKHFESVAKPLGEFSDEDEILEKKHQSDQHESKTKKITEFGGVYGALLSIFIIPLLTIALYVFCNDTHCDFKSTPNWSKFKLFSTYIDTKSILGIYAYILLLSILSAFPFGGKKVNALPNKDRKFVYVMNGLFSFFILCFVLISLEYKGVKMVNFITNNVFHLFIGGIFLGLLTAIWVHIRSFYMPVSGLNSYAVNQNGIYSFFLGREVNPRCFGIVDLKLVFFRFFIISTVSIFL